ncbi:MAG: FkbM family methyltransferase [Deltaproteobacteria bacterium]|nr:FkbM family methyltransferase [Deltaproteobacteria bacterium]
MFPMAWDSRAIKMFFYSRSFRFMLNTRRSALGSPITYYKWNGTLLYYRPGTSDCDVIKRILLKKRRGAEYWVPQEINPKVILDIGGNIGIAAVYFARRFPNAKIYSFEPVLENFEILQKNISSYPNITAFHVALGDKTIMASLFSSKDKTNHGGYSFFSRLNDAASSISVEVQHAGDFLEKNNIAEIDLIKIDAEGAEYKILTSLKRDMVKKIKFIIGELHEQDDFETLAYLSQWFRIGVVKSLIGPLGYFTALKINLKDELPDQILRLASPRS